MHYRYGKFMKSCKYINKDSTFMNVHGNPD
jgi:hypothetical protein